MISTTEQWAQFSVAGPKARELVNAVLDEPIDDESFPFMACGEVTIHGVRARLFRISFSGEHAYEIAIPPAMARRFTAISWPGPRRRAAGPTGWRR
jgi:glycine cleavage system aminomethyltransferase T